MNIFGFELRRKEPAPDFVSFTPPLNDEGALTVASGGGTMISTFDLDASLNSQYTLINKYRTMAQLPEINRAIDAIVNEAIVDDTNAPVVKIDLDAIKEVSATIKKQIEAEFATVYDLLQMNTVAYEVFQRWYVDGRLYYHIIIDPNNVEAGIKELRYIDPRKIRKIREVMQRRNTNVENAVLNQTVKEYYVYNDKGWQQTGVGSSMSLSSGVKIAKDTIAFVSSGLTDADVTVVLSYLHKAIRNANQLASIEDANIIYCLTRSVERRAFYIDVGNLPNAKIEQFMKDQMARNKNRLVYDGSTGEVRDDRKFSTMLEDYWFPRRGGNKGTEVQTLPSSGNLMNMEMVQYFQQKLFQSLNVPISRLDTNQTFNLGHATEITRDEVAFSKFIDRLRGRFANLFIRCLEKQLVLKNILTIEEFESFKNHIKFIWARDNYFAELKDVEILNDRLTLLERVAPFVGKYFSIESVKKKVLMQTDDEINDMQKEMDSEIDQMQRFAQVDMLGPEAEMELQAQFTPPEEPPPRAKAKVKP